MKTIEQEIFDEIEALEPELKKLVLDYVRDLKKAQVTDDWFARVEAFQAELAAKYGEDHTFGTQDLLDEVREEASWPRW
jgi:hypothetical protein